MKKILFLICIFALNSWADPQKIEMIFLSPHKVAMLLEILKRKDYQAANSLVAENDEKCIPMGEGCFHPQLGFIEKAPEKKPKEPTLIKEDEFKLKTFNAIETNLINCDKDNYFDIYCGKERAEKKGGGEIEVWFDISSSLRSVDYNKESDYCDRRTFMTKIQEGCKDHVRVSVYNTSIKEIGDYSSVCLATGTNDEKKLLQWMKASKAKKLLIVTDIDEVSKEMEAFLDSHGAVYKGNGVSPFTTTDLIQYAKDFVKNNCK